MSQALILPQYPGDFSFSGHTHNYASSSHTHSQYLTSHQSLTNYVTKTYVDNAVAGIDTTTVPSHTHDYASSSHTHSYASTSHTHSGYASSSHTHNYASSSHTHSDYASSSHTHSGYASSSHTHSYASSSHTHSTDDISGLSGGAPFEGKRLTGGNQTYTLSKKASFIMAFVDGSVGIMDAMICLPGKTPMSTYGSYGTVS